MGIIAYYTKVNNEKLKALCHCPVDNLLDELKEVNATHSFVGIDTFWDGLHFLLTGVSASTPVEDDPISAAIVGVTNLNEDDFVSYITHDELDDIVEALDCIDFTKLKAVFIPSEFAQADIYPDIWLDADKDRLFTELSNYFEELKAFYIQTQQEKANIIVSIY